MGGGGGQNYFHPLPGFPLRGRHEGVEKRRGEEHLTRDLGTKEEPEPKLFGLDIFGWGGGLPREGVGAKKFGMPLETREIKLFWQDNPGILLG